MNVVCSCEDVRAHILCSFEGLTDLLFCRCYQPISAHQSVAGMRLLRCVPICFLFSALMFAEAEWNFMVILCRHSAKLQMWNKVCSNVRYPASVTDLCHKDLIITQMIFPVFIKSADSFPISASLSTPKIQNRSALLETLKPKLSVEKFGSPPVRYVSSVFQFMSSSSCLI